ncbi:MAG TPA: 7-carboxy-7-deazaguanine synthase [Stellaceae bacterium]|nr:7-carboxy-7-deazaguanine synthase [Stellaceae bacterium]
MSYAVKEIFYTLQGEGALTGRPSVFCRFTGCNLWSGREEDRASAACSFCDTDFVGMDGTEGARYETADALADTIAASWPTGNRDRFVVCTGGEPLLQLDTALIDALHGRGFEIAVETNGTIPLPAELDWVCVSPKGTAELVVKSGDELKIVVPQEGVDPLAFADLAFRRFSVQPMDGPERERNTALAIRFCLDHPRWQLSLQTHKVTGIR